MPEPGVNDRNFSRPTAKTMRGPAGSRLGGSCATRFEYQGNMPNSGSMTGAISTRCWGRSSSGRTAAM
jgi:hypothetical protein